MDEEYVEIIISITFMVIMYISTNYVLNHLESTKCIINIIILWIVGLALLFLMNSD